MYQKPDLIGQTSAKQTCEPQQHHVVACRIRGNNQLSGETVRSTKELINISDWLATNQYQNWEFQRIIFTENIKFEYRI